MTDLSVSAIPYPALRLDADGRVVAANAPAGAVFAADPVGRPFATLVDEALPDAPEALATRLGDGAPLTVRAPAGQARFQARAQPWGGGALVVLVSLAVPDARGIDVDLLAKAVDGAHTPIVIADTTRPDAPLVYVNASFLALTGYTAAEVIGRNCRFLQRRPDGTRDDAGGGQAEALDALRRGLAEARPVEGVVVRNYTREGQPFTNELRLTPIRDGDGRMTHMIGVQTDVTDRVEAERERDRQLGYLRSIFAASAAPLGLLEHGPGGALVHVLRNAAAAHALGLAGAEGAGLAAAGPAAEAAWRRAAQEAGRTGAPVRFDAALHGRTFEVLLSPVAAEGGPGRFLYLAADVTDGRAAAEDLLAVSNLQFKQIAQGIHDGVGQTLVGASMHATALARDLAGTAHHADAERLRRLVARSVTQLRTFALGLDPLDLDRLGVGDALDRLAADAQAALPVRIEVVDELGPARLSEDVLLDVYRIAQEALTNAVRHGAAGSVRLGLGRGSDGRLVLHVDDDGQGIGPGVSATGGMGLRTMRARAVRHGGSLEVAPRAEGGTRVRLELPPERIVEGR